MFLSRCLKGRNFNTSIYKVSTKVHPDLSISKQCVSTLNQIVYDTIKRLCGEAENLLKINKKITMTFREIQSSVSLEFPGELRKYAIMAGTKSIAKYNESYSIDKQQTRAPIPKTKRAGLSFSVGKVKKCMKIIRCADKISDSSCVFLASVVEYLTAELLELSGNCTKENNKKVIKPRHLMLSIKNDDELRILFKKCIITNAGVKPNIENRILWSRKKKQKLR